MARPIELNANTPGRNTHTKSAAAQKPYHGKAAPMPGIKTPTRNVARRSTTGTKGATLSQAEAGFVQTIMGGNSMDYASSWMQSKGLKNSQNNGKVARLPYATVPADYLTAGMGRPEKPTRGTPKPKKTTGSRAGTSNASIKARVNTKYTGKSYKTPSVKRTVTRKARVIGA